VYVADNMGWKKLLLIFGIFVVIPAYFLYTPIPDGYSTMSACKMQLTLASIKTVIAVVGSVSETVCDVLKYAQIVIFLTLLLTFDFL